jgi:hypothetical protein
MPQTASDQPRVIGPPCRADRVSSLLRPPDLRRVRQYHARYGAPGD